MSETLKRTRLYQWHVDHGGRMVPFAGWEMPVQYPTGPIEEHHITRRSAGLFDIDHMGQITVTGPDAEAYLNRLVTWDITLMADFDAHYSLICYDHGGIVDDIFIYKLPDRWFLAVNAANLDKDYRWMLDHTGGYNVTVTNISDETYMLALQGPRAIELLQKLTPTNLDNVPRFTAFEGEVAGIPTVVGRTGYTGEDGVELFFPADQALKMWETILQTGEEAGIEVKPIGLAARDSLRFEPSFPLYGHEINEETTPLEAGLGWACKFEADFIGREALLKQKVEGLRKKLVGFELVDKGVPREGYPVANDAGEEIGKVVTGMYAPTVDKYCGHAYVPPEYAQVGTSIKILIRSKPKAAVVVKRPFYTPAYNR
ncbi:MAG: glycine cleavage system aminomethyltransferase GcvT [Chloroflexi bacterium]|nr:MAG: glycine cleavage system aminomethyltransferase GcvT [Chloroflexota bacterium]